MVIDRNEIARLTEEYGGQWGMNHTRRLLELISIIGEGMEYNGEAVWMAAHLHDWGAYPPWAEKEVEHAFRSRQVAEDFLTERSCPAKLKTLVLECIEFHHTGGDQRSLESTLLREADILDFLGVVGVLRDFSKKSARSAQGLYDHARQEKQPAGSIAPGKSKSLGRAAYPGNGRAVRPVKADSFGYF